MASTQKPVRKKTTQLAVEELQESEDAVGGACAPDQGRSHLCDSSSL